MLYWWPVVYGLLLLGGQPRLVASQEDSQANIITVPYPFVMYLLRQVAIKWNLGDNEGGEKRVEYFSLIGCHSPIM